jgi:hypothetical protein
MAIPVGRPAELHTPALRQWWIVITALLAVAIFSQAVFAGAMLSGVGWASRAHSLNAFVLVASTVTAGLVAVVTLRRVPHGPKLGLALLLLAAGVFLQTAVGKLSAHGANLMWAHVPLGVALVGFATQALAGARRLGRGAH